MHIVFGGLNMKNTKKLEQIESQIAKLQEQKKQITEKYLNSLSTKIAKSILDRKLFNISEDVIIKKINTALDEL